MYTKSVALAMLVSALLASPSLAVLEVIIDENFDNYDDGDNFLLVNPNTGPNWASGADEPGAWWRAWLTSSSCTCIPDISATDKNTSPPNSLTGIPGANHSWTTFRMMLYLPDDLILNADNGAGDATLSFDVRSRNPLETRLLVQVADGKANPTSAVRPH